MSSQSDLKFKTLKDIYTELHPSTNTRNPLAIFSQFVPKEGHVNYHDLRRLHVECGCSESLCMETRYIRTKNKEVFDVVKMINGEITVVPNDIVIL